MKYYIFYLKDNIDELYAYTSDIDIALNFINTRNMNKFISNKCKLNDSMISSIKTKYPFNELTYYSNDDKYLPMTFNEVANTRVFSSKQLNHISWDFNIDINIFNDKYISVLKDFMIDEMSSINSHDVIYNKQIIADFISCFIHLYGKLLKGCDD